MSTHHQIVWHGILTICWMVLQGNATWTSLCMGGVLGIAVLFVFRRLFAQRLYVVRVWAIVKLLGMFCIALVRSNVSLVRIVLRPQLHIAPGIVTVPTAVTTNIELTALACLVTLTPGTLTLDVSLDRKALIVHVIDVQDAQAVIDEIKNTLEKAILEVSAP